MRAKSGAGTADDLAASPTMMSAEEEGELLQAELTHGNAIVRNPYGSDFPKSLRRQQIGR